MRGEAAAQLGELGVEPLELVLECAAPLRLDLAAARAPSRALLARGERAAVVLDPGVGAADGPRVRDDGPERHLVAPRLGVFGDVAFLAVVALARVERWRWRGHA